MTRPGELVFAMSAIGASLALATFGAGAAPPMNSGAASQAGQENAAAAASAPANLEEARGRARLLHETIHSTLHLVHHQYYRQDEGLELPAAALKSVFGELAERQKVKLRWLAVNAQAMNVSHNPGDDFEREAVKALTSGKAEFELAENGVYQHAGAIKLTSECLKCHLPNRTSTKARTAALVIEMPIKKN